MARIAVLALLSIAAAAAPTAGADGPTALASHRCADGYKHATIEGEHKCLHAGQICARRHQAIYHRKGFHCKRNLRLKTR